MTHAETLSQQSKIKERKKEKQRKEGRKKTGGGGVMTNLQG